MFNSIKVKLEYNIKLSKKNHDSLDVSLKIHNCLKAGRIDLFKGNMKIAGYCCYDSESHYLITGTDTMLNIYFPGISRDTGELVIEYTVSLGHPGKHGKQGIIDRDFIMFEGSGVLLFPTDMILGDDDFIREKYDSVFINYSLPFKDKAVPYLSGNCTLATDLDWMKCYDLRASCYAFGGFFKRKYNYTCCSLNIFTLKNGQYEDYVYQGIFQIFKFYCDLFSGVMNETGAALSYDLILPDYNDRIMGGSGSSCAGYSFDPSRLRDWEVLGHRMFHAFFDTAVSSRWMRIPPQLWLYEGLASYYENLCLDSLNSDIKEKIGYSRDDYIRKLALRYLYFRIKDSRRFSLIPAQEKNYLKDKALSEFLHYTQAPLLVYIIENIVGCGKSSNAIIYEIFKIKSIKNKHKSDIIYNSKDILFNVFASSGNKEEFWDISRKYVYGDEIYPVKIVCSNGCDEDPEAVIEDLNYYCYVIWSWSIFKNPDYRQVRLIKNEIEYFYAEAVNRNVKFAGEETEKLVKDISPTLHKILKAEAIHELI